MVVAAPASGAGKTTVATGLMAALRRRGTTVAGFKVGPDYIDPGYHALATGRPGRNLDPVLVGQRRVVPLAAYGAAGAQLAVVEGVMGLFDGRTGTAGHGSTAQVAALLGAPVLLVVDVRGQGRSLAALLHGFRSFDADVRIAGVVLNRVGSARHEQICRQACAEVGLPVLGALRWDDALAVPSRHLGLVTAAEHATAAGVVARWADAVTAQVDLDAVVALAGASPGEPQWAPETELTRVPGAPVVAVAGGPAFTFGYPEHAELLAAAGAAVAVFDPLREESLPAGTAGLVLPGGFPECHAEALSANAALRAEVAALARRGAPVHAECGGLLYLCRSVDGAPMCGVLDAEATMTGHLVLGYRDAVALRGSVLHHPGERVHGHEFHRSTVTPRAGEPAWAWTDAQPEGFVQGGVHASFLHTHPVAHPTAVARFVASCVKGGS
ncbi:MAG: cobyrinate a,c-diamide synthase [Pseudonocardiales bacterium]|nr:cobyrinate a,c-diamide synthase [Pseudonocardiales bacterium]MBV9029482.1 cobyrinate a,c-diamide synthase [Pseudonocardiales bacterium]MBW0010111.1 cobyrinate a,c-diamide synthase [Pseudonocardiales bacterium]